MKNYLFPVLLIVSLFTFSAAKADHVMGSDITYKCTSTPGMFEITYTFYRACTGIPVCPSSCGSACSRTLQLRGADPSCAASTYGSVSLTLQSVSDVQDNICPSVKNICNNMGCVTPGSYTPAIEKYVFTGIANLGPTSGIPASCCNVRVVFDECCRNAEINTGATWQNFYTDVVINRCFVTTPCNNGPKAINDPMFVVAGGANVQFSMAMFDAEGDSLTYSFVPSLQGFGSSVSYDPPWAYNKPLPWTGAWNGTFPEGISVGPQDGIVRFTPMNYSGYNFYGIFAVEALEWKTIGGVPTVVSKTRRDAECAILANGLPNNSPNVRTEPPLASSALSPKKDWIVCPGEQICFTIFAKDTDITDTVKLTFAFPPKMAGATITPLSGPSTREDSVRFCWTPHDSVASYLPYAFVAKVRDNFCPVDGKAHFNFTIKVVPNNLIDSISKTSSGCNKWNLGYSRLPNTRTPYATGWRISKTPNDYSMTNVDVFTNVATVNNRIFSDTGKYLVELTLTADSNKPSCVDVKYDTIVVNTPQIKITLNDTSTCKSSIITIQPSVNRGWASYTWMNFGNPSTIGSSPTLLVSIGSTSKKIVLKVTDSLFCSTFDTITVAPKAMPVLSYNTPGGLSKCLNDNPFTFINTSVDTNIAGCVYGWKINDTLVSSNDTLVHSLFMTGNNTVKLLVTIPGGCSDSLSKTAAVSPSPVAGFTINNDTQCYKNNSFVFANASSINPPSTLTHQWNFGNGNTSAVTNPSAITYATAGTYTVRLVASAINGCRDTLIKSITIHPQPILSFTLNGASQCLNTNSFIATNTTLGSTDPSLSFIWKSESSTGNSDTFTQTYTTTGIKNIQLNLATAEGCKDSLVKTATVLPSPQASFTINDSIQCLRGNSFVFTNTSGAGNSVLWNIDGQSFATPNVTKTFTSAGTRSISQTVTNPDGCKDSTTKTISFLASPVVGISVNDNDQCLGDSFVFTHSNSITPPATIMSGWAFSDSVYASENPYTRTFAAAGTYRVYTGTVSSEGCADSASLTITVRPFPVPYSITGPLIASYAVPHIYLTGSFLGYTYDWFITNGTILSGNGTNGISVNWDSTATQGKLQVIQTTAFGCKGDTADATVIITGPVGIKELNSFDNIQVFPNPASEQLFVSLQTLKQQQIHITLTNILGTEVLSTQHRLSSGSFEEQINTADLPRGMYLLSIKGEYSSTIMKVILK